MLLMALGWIFSSLFLVGEVESYTIDYAQSNDSLTLDLCDKIENSVHHRESLTKTLDISENLPGKWVSSECEVRPGPEFLLRMFEFSKQLKFILHIYYYADRDCRFFLYGIKVWGRLRVERSSWIVSGASENDVQVHRVDIIPYMDTAARDLKNKLSGLCSESLEWTPFETQTLYTHQTDGNYPRFPYSEGGPNGLHCLEALGTLFNELQLGRVIERPHHHGLDWKEELFFGDIHTKIERRTRYRPTALQAHGLVRGRKESSKSCRTCQKVAMSNIYNPPRLRARFFIPVTLEGEWISRRCETRPNSLFLMRRIIFHPWNRSWDGTYSYFADENCSKIVFKIFAKGKYLQKGKSTIVDGGTDFDFKIKSASLLPETKPLVHQLNSLPLGSCGSPGLWSVGIPQDVTPTGGCEALGLSIPITELDLLKMESTHDGRRLLLSLGKTDSDAALKGDGGVVKEDEASRPTSYQPPLLQCKASNLFLESHKHFPVLSQLKLPPSSLSRSPSWIRRTCFSNISLTAVTLYLVAL